VDEQGRIKARYLYDPFGNLLAQSGPLAEANLYRFSGKEIHPQSGLYYYGFRWYDPNLQRWLNADPIGLLGGRNKHAFVGNNPVNRVDYLGLADDAGWVKSTLKNLFLYLFWGESHTDSISDPNSLMRLSHGSGSVNDASITKVTDPVAELGDLLGTTADTVKNVSEEGASMVLGETIVIETGTVVAKCARRLVQINRHHAWPKYLGGPGKQVLETLPRDLHKLYHKGLDELLPRWRSSRYYRNLPPEEQAINFGRFRKYTEAFDKQHGTTIWEAVLKVAAAEP